MRYWTTAQLFERLIKEAGADGILVSINRESRSVRFQFLNQGCLPQEFNFASEPLPMISGQPMDHEEDMCRMALMRAAYEARVMWKRDNPYFRWTDPPKRATTDGPRRTDDLRDYMERVLEEAMRTEKPQPQGTTTIISAVDVSTGKECPVRELPRIEPPKKE